MTLAEWEAKFDSWSQGPSKPESEKCDHAESMVQDAISAYPGFRDHTIRVFTQGSYRNRTNVRFDSDVDVCVLSMDTFFGNYEQVPGVTRASLGFTESDYQFPDLKRDVEAALVAKFGRDHVIAGEKAFDIKSNTYRVAADVVPTFEGRVYHRNSYGGLSYHSGTILECRSTGSRINNWPQQHYDNGGRKHTATSRQFKKKARCLKSLANDMAANGYKSSQKMSSFLLESLVYNCKADAFNQKTHYDDMKKTIRQAYFMTQTDEAAEGLVEVNERKYLFHPTQPWNREDVHQFLSDAWQYVGFED